MIVTSITGPTMVRALSQVRASRKYADLLEFRLDLIDDFNFRDLLRRAHRPCIVTCRPDWEGGAYRGPESERLEILKVASAMGAHFIDLEQRAGSRAISTFAGRRLGSRLIVSRHYIGSRPTGTRTLFRSLQGTGADVIKLAFDITDVWENVFAFEFLAEARKARVRAIAIATGEAGEPSRVLYRKFGGWATYASPESGPAAAPGQISGKILRTVFRSPALNGSTRIFGLLGNPVAQSKGFLVHNRLFARYGLNAVYCRFPAQDLKRFFASFMPHLHGCSVTTPFKEAVIPYVRPDRAARTIGAVNTIYRGRRDLHGTNCDAPAALDAVERERPVRDCRLLVLGAGGTARSVLYEAMRRGACVWVANRTHERAAALAEEFGAEVVPMDRIAAGGYDVVINATSAGMDPAVNARPIKGSVCGNAVVLDAVYNPPLTRFLREARDGGATIIPGAAMFIRQAAAQFQLFTGITPTLRLLTGVMQKSFRP